MKTTALVFRRANEPSLEDVPVPALRDDEVLMRTHYSGVSIGTEQSIFSGVRTHNGTFPLVTGYMASGIIEAVGDAVTNVAVGDTVAASNARLEGEVRSVWGAHLGLRVVPARGVWRLPRGLEPRDAAMWVMPRVGLHALNVVAPRAGDTLVVQGQGLIGQFFGQFARRRGCRVIAIEPAPDRARLARQYVTEHILDPRTDDVAGAIAALTDGKGADIIVEATGNKQLIGHATSLLRAHAAMVFLGWYPGAISLDYDHFHNNSVTAYFPMGTGGPEVARAVLDALADGTIVMGENITDVVPLREACDGFRRIIAGDRSIMGMVIDWSDA